MLAIPGASFTPKCDTSWAALELYVSGSSNPSHGRHMTQSASFPILLYSSRSWWRTGKPGVLPSMGSQRVGHDWETELTDWLTDYMELRESSLRLPKVADALHRCPVEAFIWLLVYLHPFLSTHRMMPTARWIFTQLLEDCLVLSFLLLLVEMHTYQELVAFVPKPTYKTCSWI